MLPAIHSDVCSMSRSAPSSERMWTAIENLLAMRTVWPNL